MENAVPLIIVASTTVKDLFSKVDAALPLPSYLRLSFVPPPSLLSEPGLSLLQIGLVVLRVHQDNSGPGFVFLPRERGTREREREREVREDGTYCRTVRVLYVLPFSRSSSQHGFKQFLRVSPFLRLFLRRLTLQRGRDAAQLFSPASRSSAFPFRSNILLYILGKIFAQRERERERGSSHLETRNLSFYSFFDNELFVAELKILRREIK